LTVIANLAENNKPLIFAARQKRWATAETVVVIDSSSKTPLRAQPGLCIVLEAPLRARPVSTFLRGHLGVGASYSLRGIFFHVRVHVYALGQRAETRANMPTYVRVHVVVVNIYERPLDQ